MKKIITCLSFAVLFSCSNDKQKAHVKELKPNKEEITESPPIYRTDQCANHTTNEERRKCADEELVKELREVIAPFKEQNPTIGNSKLVVEFEIEISGKTKNVSIKRGVETSLDKAVSQYILKTRWYPAIHGGQKAKITRRLPIYIDE